MAQVGPVAYGAPPTNVIICGDNLTALPKHIPDESVDLVYIDPPFNSSRQYEVFWGEAQEKRAFADRYGDVLSYLEWMRPRVQQLHRVLKPTGSFYYHCDAHASHYIKVELDRLFGFENFRSEITWRRTNIHNDSKNWSAVTDSLLYYVKDARADFTWKPTYVAHSPEHVRSKYRADASGRLYTLSDMRSPNPRPNLKYEWKGHQPHPNGWAYSRETMERLDREGRIWYPDSKDKRPRLKRYLDEMRGNVLTNLWTDIDPLNARAKERIGYPTQKPLALLDRILEASSEPGQVVLDAFCGCGTSLEAAVRKGRRWVGIDLSPTACRVMSERLERMGLTEGKDFAVWDMPKTEADLRRMPHFEFQNWAVIALGGIPNRVKSGDFGIDGRLYLSDVVKEKRSGHDLFGELDRWYPIQVKQVDRVGRPDIDSFETAMRRDRRVRGYFVAFGFTGDAEREIRRANERDGLEIVPVTVQELLAYERHASVPSSSTP